MTPTGVQRRAASAAEVVGASTTLLTEGPLAPTAIASWLRRFDSLDLRAYPVYDEQSRGWNGPRDLDGLRRAPRWRRPSPDALAARDHLWNVLALSHPNGYLRQEAVERVPLSRGVAALLIVRAADWVAAVRSAAAERLRQAPDEVLFEVLPLVIRFTDRGRSTELRALLGDRVSASLLRSATTHEDAWARRAAWRRLAEREAISNEELVLLASDPDRANRRHAANDLLRLPASTRRQVATALLDDPVGGIAVRALQALVELDGDAPVLRALMSPSVKVRWTAQRLAATRGFEPREIYRARMQSSPADRAVLVGFAEMARADDVELLEPMLNHPQARVRAAALRAIGWYDASRARPAALDELERPGYSRAKRAAARILATKRLTDPELTRLRKIVLGPERPARERLVALQLTRPRRWVNLALALELMEHGPALASTLTLPEVDRWLAASTTIAGHPTDAESAIIERLLPRLDAHRRDLLAFVTRR